MKRILKLLACLYPAAWRNRYGTEYEALLEDTTPRPQDAFNILWEATKMQLTSRSFVRIVLPATICGALIATIVSFALAPRYISQSLIAVTASTSIPKDRLDKIFNDVLPNALNRDFLASLIQDYNLYPRERASMPLNSVIDKMLRSIEVRPLQAPPTKTATSSDENTSAFGIYFVYSDPKIARQVDQRLLGELIHANLVARSEHPADRDRLDWMNFRVPDQASLPTSPIFPKRGLFALGGLVAGLLCGLILATILGSRNVAANG